LIRQVVGFLRFRRNEKGSFSLRPGEPEEEGELESRKLMKPLSELDRSVSPII